MSAIQQLEDALEDRNKQTTAFLETIISIINESVDRLPFCTRANSTPEVAGSVKVLKKDLDGIIAKIKNDSNIDKGAADGLVSRLKLSNLRKLPRTSDRSSYARGSSDLDNLRFSDGNSSAIGSSRTSFASANGSPRSSYASANGSPRSSYASGTNRAYPIVEPNANGEYDFDQPPRGGKRTRRR